MRLNNLSALGLLISLELFVEITADSFRESMRNVAVPLWLHYRNINEMIATSTVCVIIVGYAVTVMLWINAHQINRRLQVAYHKIKRKYVVLSKRNKSSLVE